MTPATAMQTLDALLDEIDAKFREDSSTIHIPASAPPFEVIDFEGTTIVARMDLRMKDVVAHLRKRSARTKNEGLARLTKQLDDGSIVVVNGMGQKASTAPTLIALNDELVLYVTPRRADPKLVNNIGVAWP